MPSSESNAPSQQPYTPQDSEQEPLLGRRGDVSQDEGSTLFKNPFIGTGIIAQGGVLLLLGIVWGGIFSHKLILPFGLHPVLNVLGIALNVQAILLVQPTHTAKQKRDGAITHSVLNGTATLSFIGAFGIILYAHKGFLFLSPHAVLGLITYISIFSAGLFGFLIFYVPQLFGSIDKAKSFYKWHRIFGYLVLLLQIATISAATQTTYIKGVIHIRLWTVIFASVLILLGIVPRIKRAKLGV